MAELKCKEAELRAPMHTLEAVKSIGLAIMFEPSQEE